MIIATLLILNTCFLSPYKQKNIDLRKQIEDIENRQTYRNSENVDGFDENSMEDSSNSNIDNTNADQMQGGPSSPKDINKKIDRKISREFYERISMCPNVLSIERNSQENDNKYRIRLRGENKEFIMFMNSLDKQNKKVEINQIMYNKYEKTGEYTVLVNLFSE